MNYVDDQRRPWKSLPGLTIVVLFHLALIYALVNGLGSAVIEKMHQNMITRVLDDVKPPPPPALPPTLTPPTAPDVIPPPDIVVQHLPSTPNALTVVTRAKPAVSQPYAPPVAALPDQAFSPAHVIGGSEKPAYPDAYSDSGRSGTVTVYCIIETDGRPTHCHVLSERGGAAFANGVMQWLNGGDPPIYSPAIRGGKAQAQEHQWVVSFQAPE